MRLRELRLSRRLTVEEVAERLLCSATKVSRLETGARKASLRDVRDLIGMYEVADQAEAEYLMSLARQAREPGWWEQRLEARMRRKQVLDRPSPPRYRAIVDEAVLRRFIGGPAIMRAQLGNILQCAKQDKATLQVLPFTTGEYGSVDSNFALLEFDQQSMQRPVVFVESLFSNLYQERPAEVQRYSEATEYLRDKLARDDGQTVASFGCPSLGRSRTANGKWHVESATHRSANSREL